MITVDINAFRKNLKKYLSTPCQVTRYGIAIASIIPTGAKEVKEIKDPVPLGMKKTETTYIETPKRTGWSKINYQEKIHWMDEFGNDKGVVE